MMPGLSLASFCLSCCVTVCPSSLITCVKSIEGFPAVLVQVAERVDLQSKCQDPVQHSARQVVRGSSAKGKAPSRTRGFEIKFAQELDLGLIFDIRNSRGRFLRCIASERDEPLERPTRDQIVGIAIDTGHVLCRFPRKVRKYAGGVSRSDGDVGGTQNLSRRIRVSWKTETGVQR